MFALSGQKWGTPTYGTSSGPVYWSADYIDTLDYDDSLWTKADFDLSLQNAFQAWENVAGIDFEMADAENSADVTVETASLAGSTVGLATYTFTPTSGVDQFVSARVDFDENETWSPEGQGGDLDFYAVALHEIGHVIGLNHVNDVTEILNPTIVTDELGDGDIAGAVEIYGPPAEAEAPAPAPGPDGGTGIILDVEDEPAPEPEPEPIPEPTPTPEGEADPEPDVETTPEVAEETAPEADDGGSGGAVAGVMGLMGVGIMVLVGGAAGFIGGGVLAALGLLSGGGSSGGGTTTTGVAGRSEDDDFFDGLPTITFSTTGMGCPYCGDDSCGCIPEDGDDADDTLL